MSRIRGKHTTPELKFRHALFAAGARYRCHPKDVPGRPDVVHKGARIAVFIDGCFWHGCPQHFKAPKTRTKFWTMKIRRNRATRRDALASLGPKWRVFEYFECELEGRWERAAQRVAQAIQKRRGAT